MRTFLLWFALFGFAALSLASVPLPTQAESFSMSAGMQNASGDICYRWSTTPNGSIGARKSSAAGCSGQRYVMPLYWKTFSLAGTNRTVTVRGRVPSSASTLSCTLSVYNSNGVLVSQASNSFAVTGAGYGSISLTVNNVLSTSSSFISCASSGPETYLLKVDYTP